MSRRWPVAVLAAVLAFAPVLGTQPARAAEEPAATGAPSVEELQALVASLQDERARARLVAELRALIAAQRGLEAEQAPPVTGNVVLRALSERIEAVGRGAQELAFGADSPRRVAAWLAGQVREPERRGLWLRALLQAALAVAIGVLSGWAAALGLKRPRASLERREVPEPWLRATLLAARTVLDLLPIAAFAVAAYAVLAVVQPDERARLVMLAAVNAVVIARAGIAIARLLLTPLAPSLRLIWLKDETAAYAFVWARRLINIPVYGYFGAQAMLALGLPEGGYDLFIKLLGLIVAAMLFVLVLQNRTAVADAIRGAGAERAGVGAGLRTLKNRLADVWHIPAALYLVMIYGVWVLEFADGFQFIFGGTVATVVVLGGAKLLVNLVRRGLVRAFRISAEIRVRYPLVEARADRYLTIVGRALEWVVWIAALVLVLQAWRIDALGWLSSGAGRTAIGGAVEVAVVLVIAAMVWESANAAVTRFLEAADAEGKVIERSARIRTLLPLARNALLAVVVIVSAITILSTLGIEIAPLLAGAGVVGLAIGFGAQTLVKDVITGAFILFEDIVSVGDIATVGGRTGFVEAINVRTIRLRDYSGTVHLIPFGSVDTITNLTKDFSYYVLNVGIAYRENVDQVFEVLREIVEEMRRDPDLGPDILEPLEISGLDRFEDSAVVIRARIKTKRIRQWAVGREFNRRMKARFDELGIEIPFPHRTIYFGANEERGPSPGRIELGGGTSRTPEPGEGDDDGDA